MPDARPRPQRPLLRGWRAALLALVLASRGAGGAAWPALSADPIAPEAVPEMTTSAARAHDDSTRSALCRTILGSELPAAPDSASPRLVAWLVQVASFARPGEVDAFATRFDPASWAGADSAGDLALACALALIEAERPVEAVRWLDAARFDDDTMPYRELLRIEARDRGGDSAGAVAAAEEVRSRFPRSGWTLPAARRLLAERERGGDTDALIRESLRTKRDLGRSADETAARFRGLRASESFGAARAVGDTLLRLYPGTRTARIEALRRFREGPAESAKREGTLLLEVFLRHRLFGAAESLLAFVPRSDSLRVGLLEALYQGRRYEEVRASTLEPQNGWSTSLRARCLLVRARAARNTGDWDRMADLYERATAVGPETRRTALTEWGREAESLCRETDGERIYSRLLDLPGSADEGRFRRAISRFASGRLTDAMADLEGVSGGEFATAAAFWRSKVASAQGDSARALRELRKAQAGGGYYAQRGRVELRAGRGGTSDFWTAERNLALTARMSHAASDRVVCPGLSERAAARAMRVRLFRRFGRAEWAEREREALEPQLPVERRGEGLLCVGLPDLAIRVAIARGASPLHLRYPRPYPEWIAERAARAGISADLMWALARRESLFDPGAISGAGARGLFQMMEATARETADRWGLPAGPLERADFNLSLGVAHFRELADRSAWHLPALLAAYNAGAAKTEEWVRLFPDPDLFIERIGWRETREYVRHVLDGYWTYRSGYPSGEGQGGGQ